MMRVPPGPLVASVEEFTAPGRAGPIPLRLYRPTAGPSPLILFVHGGGFVYGNLDTHDAMARTVAVKSQCALLSVDYRLAPEAPFPAGRDDCVSVLEWLAMRPLDGVDTGRIALCGDSAGAQIALSAALALPHRRCLKHVALLYPFLDPSCATASAHRLEAGPVLSREAMLWFWECYGGNSPPDVLGADLTGLPSVSIAIADADPLHDEGEGLAARLESAGVPVRLRRYAGMVHGCAGLSALTPIAGQALSAMANDLKAALTA
jgi:acetyl esterase